MINIVSLLLLTILCVLGPAIAADDVIKIGDSAERVRMLLGEPKGTASSGRLTILFYNDREVELENGKVVTLVAKSARKPAKEQDESTPAPLDKRKNIVPTPHTNAGGLKTNARSFPLPQHGKLILVVPSTWKQDVRQPPHNLPPTIILSPAHGDAFKVMITPIWSSGNDESFNKPEAVKRLIEANRQRMLPGAVEKKVAVETFSGVGGPGYYFLVTDKAPRPGEYPYAMSAGIGVGDLLLNVTVLCRAKDSEGITEIIRALGTAVQRKE